MRLAIEIIILLMSMSVIATTGMMITFFMFMKDVKDKRNELIQEKLKEILNRT